MSRKILAGPSQWVHSHSTADYSAEDFAEFLVQHSELWQQWPDKDHESRQNTSKSVAQCLWSAATASHNKTATAIMISMYALDDSKTHKDPWLKGTPKSQKQRFCYGRKPVSTNQQNDDEDDSVSDSPSPSRPATPILTADNETAHKPTSTGSNQLPTPDSTHAKQWTTGVDPYTLGGMITSRLQTQKNMRKLFYDLQKPIDEGQAELNRTPPQDPARKTIKGELASLRALQDNLHHSAGVAGPY